MGKLAASLGQAGIASEAPKPESLSQPAPWGLQHLNARSVIPPGPLYSQIPDQVRGRLSPLQGKALRRTAFTRAFHAAVTIVSRSEPTAVSFILGSTKRQTGVDQLRFSWLRGAHDKSWPEVCQAFISL